jgi:hypothetical protein
MFKLLTKDGVWQTLLNRKYMGLKAISHAFWKPGNSHFWAGLMAMKKHFFCFKSFSIKDGLYVFGRISGEKTSHSENSTLLYIILFATKVMSLLQ